MQKVNKLVLDNAKNLAIKLSSEEIRKRVFVLSAAAMSVSDLLDDGDLKLKHKNSLFKITALDDVLEIADLYSDDVRVDVRVIYDGNTFYVPKSHEKFFAIPEIYLVVRMTHDIENIEPIGFIESGNLPKIQSNTEYFEYNVDILKPIGELKNAISRIEKKQQIFSKEAHAKIEELAIAFLDNEISDSEKIYFIQHLMKCPFCREKLSEMNEFDNVVKQLNKYPDLLNDQTLDILTGALTRAYSLPEAQPVYLPDDDEEEAENESADILSDGNFSGNEENSQAPEEETDDETESFLVEDDEEKINEYETDSSTSDEILSGEPLLQTGISEEPGASEIAGSEVADENIEESLDEQPAGIIQNAIQNEYKIMPAEKPETDNETLILTEENKETSETKDSNDDDDFLLDFADEDDLSETSDDEEKDEMQKELTFQDTEKNTENNIEPEDLDFIDENKTTANNPENLSTGETEELTEKNPEQVNDSKNSGTITEETFDTETNNAEENEPININDDTAENLELDTLDDDLLLLEDKDDLDINIDNLHLDTEQTSNLSDIEDIQPKIEEESEPAVSSAAIAVDNGKAENTDELDNNELEDLLDDNLKNILGFNESDDLTKTENTTEDLNLENLMDDELIQLLEDNNAENVKKSSVTSDSVPKQIAQKLSQIDNDESIEMLYDETPQGENGEAQINIQESPVVKSAVNKTKKIAVSLFLILILLAGGATTYFMKFGKTTNNVTGGDDNSGDENALFDFANKPAETEEPPVPQDINKSMTNVFSEQPASITITKISWNVSDKLAQNESFKNYLQVAGKNLQINLQNDLANTTEFAYNNKIHLNFQVTKNNEIKNLQVLDSSGSEQIDNVVLRSIKETLKYVNAPNLKDIKGDYNLSLVINF